MKPELGAWGTGQEQTRRGPGACSGLRMETLRNKSAYATRTEESLMWPTWVLNYVGIWVCRIGEGFVEEVA